MTHQQFKAASSQAAKAGDGSLPCSSPAELIFDRNQALINRVARLKKSRCSTERMHGRALESTLEDLKIGKLVKVIK